MKNKVNSSILVLVFAIILAPLRASTSGPPDDYAVYSVYLFNFTKYVVWPSGSKAVKIGIVENAEAEANFQKMGKTKSTPGAEITVVNTRNEIELGTCQIIFVPSNNTSIASKLIERFKGQPILIVTEDAEFTKKGASISFKVVSGKLRFQVNEASINAGGMKIAGYLTALADK
jgi:hypothetical protein